LSNEVETYKKLDLYFIVTLCVVAILVEILAAASVLKPESESPASWFQRSGAITSVFCAFAQLRSNNFLESIRGGTFAESWTLYHLFNKWQNAINWGVTFVAIWGAFIWGYGDLLFKHITGAVC
jgi:glucan phosphoethanolaminetransferase (alkaline phosphatase superfamily)